MSVVDTMTTLIGAWELLSREDVTSDGEQREEPNLGRDPVSCLMYDATGHFSVQLMRRNRGAEHGDKATDGYDAYFGRYSVNRDGTVTQELIGAISPTDVGKVVTRNFQVAGNELIITLDARTNTGESVTRTLRWRRLT